MELLLNIEYNNTGNNNNNILVHRMTVLKERCVQATVSYSETVSYSPVKRVELQQGLSVPLDSRV